VVLEYTEDMMKNFNNASNQNTIKQNNRSLILRLLNSLGQVSRAELSRITGLTKTSITNIINEMIEEGLLTETGTADSSSGRKPVLLQLSENSRYALGVYISRDFAYTNLVNLKGDIIKESRYTLELTENEPSFLSAIYEGIKTILKDSGVKEDKILGIGIASIGPLDIQKGIILDPPNFRGLKSIPIVQALKEKFGFEVFLDNDMNAAAIAEKLYGNAKNISDFIYVGVTNGIGAGIYLHNSIFRGCHGFAGEIGHTTIDIRGDRCACGNLGCLELFASIPNIVNQVRTSLSLGMESELSNAGEITWESVVAAARKGDQISLKAIEKLTYYLSVGLVNTINTFDPEVLFLGHEVALAGDLVTKPLQEMLNGNILFRNFKQVDVNISKFADYSPCIGAPSIILNRFFNGET
jgi:predicted NBD/HSP70 family sugar kinase